MIRGSFRKGLQNRMRGGNLASGTSMSRFRDPHVLISGLVAVCTLAMAIATLAMSCESREQRLLMAEQARIQREPDILPEFIADRSPGSRARMQVTALVSPIERKAMLHFFDDIGSQHVAVVKNHGALARSLYVFFYDAESKAFFRSQASFAIVPGGERVVVPSEPEPRTRDFLMLEVMRIFGVEESSVSHRFVGGEQSYIVTICTDVSGTPYWRRWRFIMLDNGEFPGYGTSRDRLLRRPID